MTNGIKPNERVREQARKQVQQTGSAQCARGAP